MRFWASEPPSRFAASCPDRRTTPNACYFTRLGTAGLGPDWFGVTMHPIVHPTALVRAGNITVETELLDGDGYGTAACHHNRTSVRRLACALMGEQYLAGHRHRDRCDPRIGSRSGHPLPRATRKCDDRRQGRVDSRGARQERLRRPRFDARRIERSAPRSIRYLSRLHRQGGRYLKRWNLVVPPDACIASLEPSHRPA